jgi:hypothetical protein
MPHSGLTSVIFPHQKCAASTVSVCDMRRLGVRLTPFYCATCAVLCIQILIKKIDTYRERIPRIFYCFLNLESCLRPIIMVI